MTRHYLEGKYGEGGDTVMELLYKYHDEIPESQYDWIADAFTDEEIDSGAFVPPEQVYGGSAYVPDDWPDNTYAYSGKDSAYWKLRDDLNDFTRSWREHS